MTATVPLADELLESLGLIRRHTRRRVGRPWPTQQLSGAQAELLRHVRRSPGTSVAEAAAELGVAANTVSTLVTALVGDDLIRREPDPADRRVARLRLTPATQRQVDSWRDRRSALVATALDELDDADRAAIGAAVPALARLAGRLREQESQL